MLVCSMQAKFPEQQVALQSEHNSGNHIAQNFRESYFCECCEFQLFVKLFQQKFQNSFHVLTARVSMENILGQSYRIQKQRSPKKYLTSRDSFTDSCKLE